ncbi:MAG: nitroreductase family protein [Hyphomicrobiales bacterium]|nr:nitroreductase family protein [Hyphomicrobiales bacterium]
MSVTKHPATIVLPAPHRAGGRPLLEALNDRRSTRELRADAIGLPVLSSLLWAAFGINRRDGHRTAPSARNWQEIEIYAALAHGLYLYDPAGHALSLVLAQDIRAATGLQDFVATAPLDLVYVADLARMETHDRTEQRFYSAIDTGFISQNVYLFCASEGLATVVRGLVDRRNLARIMQLRPQQRVIVAQTVGYPAQQ